MRNRPERNGQPFALPCVFVARVRDGAIVESRDYGDRLGLARAFGRLDFELGVNMQRARFRRERRHHGSQS